MTEQTYDRSESQETEQHHIAPNDSAVPEQPKEYFAGSYADEFKHQQEVLEQLREKAIRELKEKRDKHAALAAQASKELLACGYSEPRIDTTKKALDALRDREEADETAREAANKLKRKAKPAKKASSAQAEKECETCTKKYGKPIKGHDKRNHRWHEKAFTEAECEKLARGEKLK